MTHDDLLTELRAMPSLKEKSPEHFYRKSKPCLHFHGAGDAMVADLRTTGDWERLPAGTPADRRTLLARAELDLA
jgi:hypothetical protein